MSIANSLWTPVSNAQEAYWNNREDVVRVKEAIKSTWGVDCQVFNLTQEQANTVKRQAPLDSNFRDINAQYQIRLSANSIFIHEYGAWPNLGYVMFYYHDNLYYVNVAPMVKLTNSIYDRMDMLSHMAKIMISLNQVQNIDSNRETLLIRLEGDLVQTIYSNDWRKIESNGQAKPENRPSPESSLWQNQPQIETSPRSEQYPLPQPSGSPQQPGYTSQQPNSPMPPQVLAYQPVPTPQYAGYPGAVAVRQPKNGMAIAGFVLGILGVFTSWILVGLPFCVVGLVLSLVGMRSEGKEMSQGKGMAIAGLVLSIIGIVVGIGVIVAIIVSSPSRPS